MVYGQNNLPFILIIGSLISAFAMPLLARWKREWCAPLAIVTSAGAFILSLIFVIQVSQGHTIDYAVAAWDPPWGIEIVIDPITSLMAALVTGIYFMISVYSLRALPAEIGEEMSGWYYVEYMLCMTAMLGLIVTRDIFNMYVFIEVVGISACALVIGKGSRIAMEATLKYLILATIGSGFILLGIGFVYMMTGYLNMVFAGDILQQTAAQYPHLVWVTMGFFVVGFGIKSALFPLHLWLPDAHSSAPSPSSAILSGLVVKAYIVSLFKVFAIVFGVKMFLGTTNIRVLILIMASAAILIGSFFAFVQLELKRRLAYSTVAQVGYVFLGISLGTPEGIMAAFFHIIVHAVMKTVLFLCAGAIYRQTGKKKVTELAGIGYSMPVTMGAFLIASFSMVGIPATGGFISKFYLGLGSLTAGQPFFIILIVISGLLNAAYYFPILWQAYFVHEGRDGSPRRAPVFKMDRVPVTMLAPISILAAVIIALGFLFNYCFDFLGLIVSGYFL
ncbi:MAG: monovalent cation/H+ antiporter subunit D family protein [Firmicutes bacterium]|nr:monovalent cation/H+ antiporter subunit D family protein [Bacillota bacterium]